MYTARTQAKHTRYLLSAPLDSELHHHDTCLQTHPFKPCFSGLDGPMSMFVAGTRGHGVLGIQTWHTSSSACAMLLHHGMYIGPNAFAVVPKRFQYSKAIASLIRTAY